MTYKLLHPVLLAALAIHFCTQDRPPPLGLEAQDIDAKIRVVVDGWAVARLVVSSPWAVACRVVIGSVGVDRMLVIATDFVVNVGVLLDSGAGSDIADPPSDVGAVSMVGMMPARKKNNKEEKRIISR
jgi:hypothetical protein